MSEAVNCCHVLSKSKSQKSTKPIKTQEVQWNRRQHMNTTLLLRSLDPPLFACLWAAWPLRFLQFSRACGSHFPIFRQASPVATFLLVTSTVTVFFSACGSARSSHRNSESFSSLSYMHASYPMPSYNIKYLYSFTLYISLYAIMMCHTMHDA